MRNNQSLKINSYRKEIDGLRAIAVVAVIINHFDKKFLNSGYLGVDIFFVISGFVITSSIDRNTYENFIDFLIIFYEKRIKRILPALAIFVFFTSIFICLIIQKPEYYLLVGRRSLLGISNLLLFQTSTDYFANSSALNPFLHTWSLSVEEQFYFIFPFLIWFTGFARKNKNGFRNFCFVLITLTFLSLISFLFFYQKNFAVAYFLMPLRFWEIGIGSISYLLLKYDHKNKFSFVINKNFSILKNSDFLFLIIVLLLFLPNNYGQFSTILIVFSSAILIYSINKNSISYKILTNTKLVKIGLLSYSLYLWHWGIIVFSRWTIGVHWWSIPFQIIFIYFSALLSYRFIESPTRRIIKKKKYTFFTAFFVLISLFNGLKYFGLQGELISKIYKLNPLTNNSINAKKWTGFDVRCLDLPSTLIRTDNCKKVVINPNINNLIIIGDSHAQQSTFIVNKSLPKGKYNDGYISPINYGDKDLPGVLYGLGDLDKAKLTQYILNNLKPNDIILIAFHRGRFNSLVDNHVNLKKDKRLTKRGVISAKTLLKLGKKINSKGAKLILLRDTPLLPENVKDTTICNTWRKLKLNNCEISLKQDLRTRLLQDKVFDLAISLAEANGFKIYSWDPILHLYEDKEKFRDIDKSGNLLMRDQNHITEYAATKLSIFFKQYLYDQKIIN